MKIEIPNKEVKTLVKEELLKLLKEFDFKLTLDLKNKEESPKKSDIRTPEVPAQTGASSIQKISKPETPKKKEINNKKRKILSILANSDKELNLPEINEKLGIPENNYPAKTRTRYILDLLKKENKINIKKINKSGYLRNYYFINKNETKY